MIISLGRAWARRKNSAIAAKHRSIPRPAGGDFELGMLKSVHLGSYTLRPDEYRVAIDFFRAIGFDCAIRRNFALFLASQCSLTVRMLRPGESKRGEKSSDRLSAQIAIEVSNPEVVRDIAERMKPAVKTIQPASDASSNFCIELPGKLFVHVSEKADEPIAQQGNYDAQGKRFAIVVSRFNAFITERLLSGALDALCRSGASKKAVAVVWVPGAFEIPAVARTLATSQKYDALICLGCLLRGDTAHYDVIANEVSRGIGQSAQETGVPHAFGILTCDNLEQAIDRAGLKMGNKGFEAALAAIEMANVTKAVAARRSSSRRKGEAIGSKRSVRSRRRKAT
jgi:6,7-dimethyl-8-ribityllumazine synthase